MRHLLRRGDAVLVLVPFAAFLAALGLALAAAGPGWAAVVAWVVAASIVGLRVAGSRLAEGGGYGREVAARALLFSAAAVGAVRHAPAHRGVVWAVTAVLLISVLLEPLLLRALVGTRAVHALPGYRLPRVAAPVPLFGWSSFALLVAAGVLGLLHSPAAAWLVLLAVAVILAAGTGAIGSTMWRDRTPRHRRLRQAVEAYAPEFLLYTGRDDGGAYQLAMWLPYLERLGVRYLVVVRAQGALDAVTSLTGAPIVCRVSLRDLDDVMVDSVRAAFYPSSAANNGHAVAYRHMCHVYLGHGDSDKALSPHPLHAIYDRVFVAGQAAVDRYHRNGVHIRRDAFVVIGRPQLDALRRAASPMPARPSVLYAPTWSGHNAAGTNSSLPDGLALVQALLAHDVNVVFRPHPISRRVPAERAIAGSIDELLRADAARSGRAHRFGASVDGEPFIDSANSCDVLIADMSSILVDFLGADKPMAVNVLGADSTQDFLDRFPVANGAYLLEPGLVNLATVLDDMVGPDPMRPGRHRTREYYLGGLDGPAAAQAFVAAARDALHR